MLYSPRIARNYTVQEIKDELLASGIPMRPYRDYGKEVEA